MRVERSAVLPRLAGEVSANRVFSGGSNELFDYKAARIYGRQRYAHAFITSGERRGHLGDVELIDHVKDVCRDARVVGLDCGHRDFFQRFAKKGDLGFDMCSQGFSGFIGVSRRDCFRDLGVDLFGQHTQRSHIVPHGAGCKFTSQHRSTVIAAFLIRSYSQRDDSGRGRSYGCGPLTSNWIGHERTKVQEQESAEEAEVEQQKEACNPRAPLDVPRRCFVTGCSQRRDHCLSLAFFAQRGNVTESGGLPI